LAWLDQKDSRFSQNFIKFHTLSIIWFFYIVLSKWSGDLSPGWLDFNWLRESSIVNSLTQKKQNFLSRNPSKNIFRIQEWNDEPERSHWRENSDFRVKLIRIINDTLLLLGVRKHESSHSLQEPLQEKLTSFGSKGSNLLVISELFLSLRSSHNFSLGGPIQIF